jgi:hypothetical protein
LSVYYPPVDFDEPPEFEKSGDHAEWDVLCALQSLDNHWRIFHGIKWRYTDNFGEHCGEADVIIFHPDFGVLVIEVKGGGVRLKNGIWYYLNLFDYSTETKMKQSPCSQASRSRYYFDSRLKNTPLGQGILNNTAFTHTAWFPDFEWTEPLPPELPGGSFVLDSRHVAQPEKHLKKILTQSHPNATSWSPKEIDMLIKSLVPEINLIPPLGAALGSIRDKLFKMTEGQVNTLRALKSQKRLLVEGCAGSGKTLLAVRMAHDHLQNGKRVLFSCYNKNLAQTIAKDFSGYKGIDVVNFHELVKLLCERQGIDFSPPDDKEELRIFFEQECAELLSGIAGNLPEKYDTIIVDEAFDFRETWWIAMEELCHKDGSFYAFYDLNQGIFGDKENWQPPFSAEPIRLDTNVRNTRPVGEFALKIGKMDDRLNYAVDIGPKPELIKYSASEELADKVHALVTDLTVKRKVPANEIVILAPYKYSSEHLCLKDIVDGNPKLYSTAITSGDGKVRVGTIQSFKGLEADCVILCGIDGHPKACKPANLYVGASRARSLLYVMHHKDFKI